jgi:CubicO group peptidase (beta-lactamase class C family)
MISSHFDNMKKYLFFLLCLIASNSFAQKQTPDNRFVGLDTTFARVLKEWKAAGFAVAVVEKNKVVYAKGFGYSDFETKKPVTVNTQFAIGSCTKAFTASLMGILRKDGLVDFDKPVTSYLPSLKFYNQDLTNKVTLRDMMTHRTGIPRYDYSWYLFPPTSVDSMIQRIQYFEPTAGLREKWQYNNWMYYLQGVIAGKITGKTYQENIREKIFGPLEMSNSNLLLKERLAYPDESKGYQLKKDSIISNMEFHDIDAMSPAGSINSTVMDMAKWVTMWINGGKYKGKEIVPADYIAEAQTAQMVIGGGLPTKDSKDVFFSNYGLAWMLASYRGHYRVEHGGNIDGFSASTCFFPSDSIGIIVLSNQNASIIPSVVRNIIADRMLGLKYRDWQTISKSADIKSKLAAIKADSTKDNNNKKQTSTSRPLNDFTGIYNNPAYGNVIITENQDSLFGKIGVVDLWLRHSYYDIFKAVMIDNKDGIDSSGEGPSINFRADDAGNISSFTTKFDTENNIEFVKKPAAIKISKDSLLQYAGIYELSGIEVKISLKGDDMITAFVPGQPIYELLPTGTDLFSLVILSGYSIKFERDESNKIVGLIFQQPNGNFSAKRKK